MNIKALPSMGSAFFVAFVLWSRRFAVPLQKESLGGALGGALVSARLCRLPEQEVHQQSKKYTPKLHQQNKKCTNRATLVHLRQVHPLNCTNRTRSAPTELRWCT